jgi:hypothetical protein
VTREEKHSASCYRDTKYERRNTLERVTENYAGVNSHCGR